MRAIARRYITFVAVTLMLFGCAAQQETSIPDWVSCNEHGLSCNTYAIALKDWRIEVQSGRDSEPLYLSPDDWCVQDAIAVDIDRDGQTELVLLAWRQSNFGSSSPFWVQNDTTSWTQHLFIMRPTNTELTPVWMTSDLGMEVVGLHSQDTSIELVESDGTRTLWKWETWGLTLAEE